MSSELRRAAYITRNPWDSGFCPVFVFTSMEHRNNPKFSGFFIKYPGAFVRLQVYDWTLRVVFAACSPPKQSRKSVNKPDCFSLRVDRDVLHDLRISEVEAILGLDGAPTKMKNPNTIRFPTETLEH